MSKKKSDTTLEPKIRRATASNESQPSATRDEQEPPKQEQREKSVLRTPTSPTSSASKIQEVVHPAPVAPPEETKPPEPTPKPVSPHTTAAPIKPEGTVEFLTFESGSRDDFAALLSGETKLPEKRRYRIGDEAKGEIVTIGDEYLYIDLGASYEGIARISDFTNEQGELSYTVGDRVTLYVVDLRGGAITLGLHLQADGPAIEAIEQAYASQLPIEGRVASANKGGYVVVIGDVETFCPISQIERSFTEDPNVHVGQTYMFVVQDIREDGRNVIVSRSALLEKEAREAQKRLLDTLKEGDVVKGTVTRLADFGAFVDLKGVEGLLHISEIGYSHIDHPKDLLKEGEVIDVAILSIDTKGDRLKISLSRKNCIQDPWETIYDTVNIGTEVNGTVVRTESFGAFVEIAPGIEGLVHVSEMSWAKRIRHASDVVADGDTILVRVKEIDPQRRRISLSMKSLEADPWNDIEKRVQVGEEITGVVEKIEDFGAFIRLTSLDITALLPRSEMGLSRNETPYSKLTKGSEVTTRVLDIDPQRRRMALTLKSADEIEGEKKKRVKEPTSHREGSGSSLGTFGDLLKGRLKEKR